MQYPVFLENEDEGGYTAHCLELPVIISQGEPKEAVAEISMVWRYGQGFYPMNSSEWGVRINRHTPLRCTVLFG
jgi:hypothetical protein